jgi:hypothetical protein
MPDTSAAKDPNDPKGLIRESFRIEGITLGECRSIFVDWALSVPATEHAPLIEALLARHEAEPADHPMKQVLTEGLAPRPPAGRRGGRAARVGGS